MVLHAVNSSPFSISLIIPVGPAETCKGAIFAVLKDIPIDWQLIFAGCDEASALLDQLARRFPKSICLYGVSGRACQMNRAIKVASADYLWFVHVDSKVRREHIEQAKLFATSGVKALGCFKLAFDKQASKAMVINAWGANLRTRMLGVPFGDQAFIINRAYIQQVNGYDEHLAYGEDHILVWKLRYIGVPVKCFDVLLETDSRRYGRVGWLRLTLIYQWRWLRQALACLPRWLICIIRRKC